VPALERAAQVALLEGAAQVALLGRVAHTALLERAARPEQATRTALFVFSPPAAQARTLSTPRVRAPARAPIQAPQQIACVALVGLLAAPFRAARLAGAFFQCLLERDRTMVLV
jgi:hypothetical protein